MFDVELVSQVISVSYVLPLYWFVTSVFRFLFLYKLTAEHCCQIIALCSIFLLHSHTNRYGSTRCHRNFSQHHVSWAHAY